MVNRQRIVIGKRDRAGAAVPTIETKRRSGNVTSRRPRKAISARGSCKGHLRSLAQFATSPSRQCGHFVVIVAIRTNCANMPRRTGCYIRARLGDPHDKDQVDRKAEEAWRKFRPTGIAESVDRGAIRGQCEPRAGPAWPCRCIQLRHLCVGKSSLHQKSEWYSTCLPAWLGKADRRSRYLPRLSPAV